MMDVDDDSDDEPCMAYMWVSLPWCFALATFAARRRRFDREAAKVVETLEVVDEAGGAIEVSYLCLERSEDAAVTAQISGQSVWPVTNSSVNASTVNAVTGSRASAW